MTDLYLSVETVSNVLARHALSAVRGRDGRQVDPVVVAILGELAGVARDLCLPDAAGFQTLANTASQGHTRDLELACLKILGAP